MDNLTDAQLRSLTTDPENQPNQYGLTPEVLDELIATREWARRFRQRYLGCQVTAKQMFKQANEKIAKLATVLLEEFGGPTQNESACEMAIRVLREQRDQLKASVELTQIREEQLHKIIHQPIVTLGDSCRKCGGTDWVCVGCMDQD